jgi:hypothetical protein
VDGAETVASCGTGPSSPRELIVGPSSPSSAAQQPVLRKHRWVSTASTPVAAAAALSTPKDDGGVRAPELTRSPLMGTSGAAAPALPAVDLVLPPQSRAVGTGKAALLQTADGAAFRALMSLQRAEGGTKKGGKKKQPKGHSQGPTVPAAGGSASSGAP